VVDGAAWDPDVRHRRASRTDMARAIAAAEQREFDRLLADMPRRQHYWSAERIDHLRARVVAGVTMKELAGEFGLTRQAIGQVVQRHGLLNGYRLRGHRPPAMARPAGCLRPVASTATDQPAAQAVRGSQAVCGSTAKP
jgi:hypothetical protein